MSVNLSLQLGNVIKGTIVSCRGHSPSRLTACGCYEKNIATNTIINEKVTTMVSLKPVWLKQFTMFFLTEIKCSRRNLCSCGPMWVKMPDRIRRWPRRCLRLERNIFNVTALIGFRLGPFLNLIFLKGENLTLSYYLFFLQTMLHACVHSHKDVTTIWMRHIVYSGYRQNEFKTKTKK